MRLVPASCQQMRLKSTHFSLHVLCSLGRICCSRLAHWDQAFPWVFIHISHIFSLPGHSQWVHQCLRFRRSMGTSSSALTLESSWCWELWTIWEGFTNIVVTSITQHVNVFEFVVFYFCDQLGLAWIWDLFCIVFFDLPRQEDSALGCDTHLLWLPLMVKRIKSNSWMISFEFLVVES